MPAFTKNGSGKLRDLKTPVLIVEAKEEPNNSSLIHTALWDTGATNTCISYNIVKQLKLEPISKAKARTPAGPYVAAVYAVKIALPNHLIVGPIRVMEADIETDALIGMDIIGDGDFAISNNKGNGVFSFRYPSKNKIDFVAEAKKPTIEVPQVGRNSPCPCGSGKKYKQCHGK